MTTERHVEQVGEIRDSAARRGRVGLLEPGAVAGHPDVNHEPRKGATPIESADPRAGTGRSAIGRGTADRNVPGINDDSNGDDRDERDGVASEEVSRNHPEGEGVDTTRVCGKTHATVRNVATGSSRDIDGSEAT